MQQEIRRRLFYRSAAGEWAGAIITAMQARGATHDAAHGMIVSYYSPEGYYL
ncbi:hypothetical protein [Paraflavitalea pollutisoli]|uniref:hypothetical protein n=1 Tax=Paraflavitalea pollutisoli TaxID=3034143 RepID=UPI0023EB0372|nr:hypothetical protein [Paraflavitalea sp. H1-2-19X]